MSSTNKTPQDRFMDNGREKRMRLVHPGRFLTRVGMLAAVVVLVLLLAGSLRESGQTAPASPASPEQASMLPAAIPSPTPKPTPTPSPTPPPAPDGYAWSDLLVVLDPGHGGRDPGTCTADEAVQEKDITLDVALRCEQLLRAQRIPVMLTRTEDVALEERVNADLAARSQMANDADASLFVSVHVNSLDLRERGAAGVFGLESYYRVKENAYDALDDAWLATRIGEHASRSSGNKLIGVYKRSLAVLRETHMPAVLLEIGYLTNQEDLERLVSEAYRQRIAEGIVQGITEAVTLLEPQEYNGVLRILKKKAEPTAAATPSGPPGAESSSPGGSPDVSQPVTTGSGGE